MNRKRYSIFVGDTFVGYVWSESVSEARLRARLVSRRYLTPEIVK